MTRDELPELPSEVRALLRAEKAAPPLSNDAIGAMRTRLHAAIEAVTPPESTQAPPPIPNSPRFHGASLAIGALIGAFAGATAMWLLTRNEVPIRPSREEPLSISIPEREPESPDRASSRVESDEANVAIENEARTSDEIVVPAETPRRNTRSPDTAHIEAPRRETSFADERRVLDAARTAISSGHVEEGLDALRRHLRDHETGALAEERDALEIRALLELGRIGEARMYAESFRSSYPGSVFWPSIQARLARAGSHAEGEDVSTLSRP